MNNSHYLFCYSVVLFLDQMIVILRKIGYMTT